MLKIKKDMLLFDDEKVTKKIEEILANSNNESKKEELSLLIDFYNESIKEMQQKVKICKLIKDNHKRMTNEIFQLNENSKEYFKKL